MPAVEGTTNTLRGTVGSWAYRLEECLFIVISTASVLAKKHYLWIKFIA
jgi:hypothetical protein